ncbi:hypothetical protein ARMGADRAFT_1115393 [Armillaria gallica]|uniref:Uncharacterized protein n=1 Tax=Armillaria gallica TaxID=47427 RepID=A0A2H3DE47_ARMGA|nr:hypothetical protein ARMGADRAFT_1115393 [Armillaria gallica]
MALSSEDPSALLKPLFSILAVSDHHNDTVVTALADLLRVLSGFFTHQNLAIITATVLLLLYVGILVTMAVICKLQEFPFPTRDHQLDQDGLYVTEYHNLKVASVSVLQHHCKNFKLTYSGLCKNELVEKLTTFSLLGQKGWKEQTNNESALPAHSKDCRSIEQIEAPIVWSNGKPNTMGPELVNMLHDEIQQSITRGLHDLLGRIWDCESTVVSYQELREFMFIKYILTVYMSMSPEEFWVKFRDDTGSLMSFTAIGKHLCEKRAADNKCLVKKAHSGGCIKLMIRPWVIAKTYRKLNEIIDVFDADESDGDD